MMRTRFSVSSPAFAPSAPAAVAASLLGAACIAAAAAVPRRDCVDNELEGADVRPVELIPSPNFSCSAPRAGAPGRGARPGTGPGGDARRHRVSRSALLAVLTL